MIGNKHLVIFKQKDSTVGTLQITIRDYVYKCYEKMKGISNLSEKEERITFE